MGKEDKFNPTIGDHVHTVVKAGLAGVPVIGGPAAEIFAYVITPPLERRRDKFIIDISNDLERLQEKVDGFDIRRLSEDEIFVTTVTHAVNIAIKNHQKEKLDALRNVIMNSALGNRPEEDLQMLFLNFIDSFTVLHLKLLKFFSEHKSQEWIDDLKNNLQNEGAPGNFIRFNLPETLEYTFPDLKGKWYLYQTVIEDLNRNGLLINEQFQYVINAEKLELPQIQELGKKFLSFIKEPGD